MEIRKDDLQKLCPRPTRSAAQAKVWDDYVEAMTSPAGQALFDKYDISTPLRVSHLMATWACETGGFTLVWENMNYTAERILQVFRDKGIVTMAEARRLAGNPYALAERCYGLGCPPMAKMLGNKYAGDGYKFRGCGITQLTGRYSHERAATVIGCALDDVALPLNSIHGALIEWEEKKANKLADADDPRRVRRAINGGYNGYDHFLAYLTKAKRIWGTVEGRSDAIAQIGDEGDKVKEIQSLLAGSGALAGAVDGIYGPLTQRAVAGFQVSQGMTGTGKVDDKTYEALKATKPAPAVTPTRADLTIKDLKESGSETVKAASNVGAVGKITTSVGVATLADMTSGTGFVDTALDQIEQVQSLAHRAGKVWAFLLSPRMLMIAALIAIGIALWKWGNKINWRRLLDARSGANLGR